MDDESKIDDLSQSQLVLSPQGSDLSGKFSLTKKTIQSLNQQWYKHF